MTRRTLALALAVTLLLGQLPLAVAGEDVADSGTEPVNARSPVTDDKTNATDATDAERLTDSAVKDDGVAADENTTVEGTEEPTVTGDGEILLETEGTSTPSDAESTIATGDADVSLSVSTAEDVHMIERGASVGAVEPGTSIQVIDGPDSDGLSSIGADETSVADTPSAETAAEQSTGDPAVGESSSTEPGSHPAPVVPTSAESFVFVGAASAVGLASTWVFTPDQFTLLREYNLLRELNQLRGFNRARALPSAERLRDWGGRLLGLFGVHDHEDPLDNETRATVYDHLIATPGTYLSEISDATALPLGTVRYHLKVLRAEGYVTRTEIRGRQRFVPVGEELSALEAALAEDASASVLRELARDGPDSVSGLADRLDRDPSTVSYHLDKLESAELVERERTGQSVENRLTAAAAATLAEKPTAPAELTAAGAD